MDGGGGRWGGGCWGGGGGGTFKSTEAISTPFFPHLQANPKSVGFFIFPAFAAGIKKIFIGERGSRRKRGVGLGGVPWGGSGQVFLPLVGFVSRVWARFCPLCLTEGGGGAGGGAPVPRGAEHLCVFKYGAD